MLLGVRWQQNEWGSLPKKAISVNVTTSTMTVGGKDVLTVDIIGGRLKMTWTDSTWEAWKELQDSNEMKEMINNGNKRFAASSGKEEDAIGKGNR